MKNFDDRLKNIVEVEEENGYKYFNKNDLIIVGAFFGFLLGILLYTFYGPNYYQGLSPKVVTIPNGATFEDVLDSLYAKGIIKSREAMRVAAFIYGAEKGVKAGKYPIPNGLSYLDLLDLLKKGIPPEQKLVTIPEGIWQHKLAGLLKASLGLDSAKIMKLSEDRGFLRSLGIKADNLEGYLLPETYYLFVNSDEEDILRKLKSEMDALFEPETVKLQMRELGMTKHEILTLASIVEGETNLKSEYKRIAGVYHNRLKKGIKLQADPTIQYLKRFRKKYNRILYKDLEIDSPYNTYMYPGLPPGPINNPGKDAVLAAIFPEKHNYFYFVADGTGGHKFARSLNQHLKNVNSYRRWRSRNR